MSNEKSAEFLRDGLMAITASYGGDATGCNPQLLLDSLIALLAAAEKREAGKGAHGECDCGWMKSAAEYSDGMTYYRGLIVKIGEIIGQESKIADDGSDMGEVLCAKVPELVSKLKASTTSTPTAASVIAACKVALEFSDHWLRVGGTLHEENPVKAAFSQIAAWEATNG